MLLASRIRGKSKRRKKLISWLSYGEVYETPVWILCLMMSLNKKHDLLCVTAKLVEASDCQHLPKSHISPYVLAHFSRSHMIWNPLTNLKRDGLVGCARKKHIWLG